MVMPNPYKRKIDMYEMDTDIKPKKGIKVKLKRQARRKMKIKLNDLIEDCMNYLTDKEKEKLYEKFEDLY